MNLKLHGISVVEDSDDAKLSEKLRLYGPRLQALSEKTNELTVKNFQRSDEES
jgi:hypothetical protein